MAPKEFSTRYTVVLELPLAPNTRVLRPEQVIVKIGDQSYDFGAYYYALRSDKARKRFAPREVVLGSFLSRRANQIRQLIKIFSSFLADQGMRPVTVGNYAHSLKEFMDWADASGHPDCLAGGEATRCAYRAYVADVEERYRRHEFESANAFLYQKRACTVLQAVTGLDDLSRGLRLIRNTSGSNGGTEPAAEHDFAHALALNNAIFNGLCNLVLDRNPFPCKLDMPQSLGWKGNFLWVFPTNVWRLPPHLWGEAREKFGNGASWSYDYEHGRLATVEEIWQRYAGRSPTDRRERARESIRRASAIIDAANRDPRHRMRIMLAMHAHNAFLFLFLANTGANLSVVQGLETDGTVADTTANQGYRVIKCRAQGKEVAVTTPVAFMPHLRRFLELRRFLLNGANFPYLFFTRGNQYGKNLAQINPCILHSQYTNLLRDIDPKLPRISARKIRATVNDYFRRKYDAAITARLMGHSEEVANKSYLAGSPVDHTEEMTRFLTDVSKKAKEQKIVPDRTVIPDARILEDGGVCACFGHPEPLTEYAPVKPDCRKGCLFCVNRILVANESDARKVASAAYVMEQLILGPMSEAEFRFQIQKCDEDLAKIATFDGCREMVERVKLDVYENGNLTPYFADKFQLFLDLGVM